METNIEHTRWDTFFKSMTFKDVNWTAINLTDCTITFTIKEKITDTVDKISQVATITNAVGWLAEINIPWATMEIALKNYYYDIEFIDSNWVVVTILKWIFTVSYDITN
jgi:hypothetical protein